MISTRYTILIFVMILLTTTAGCASPEPAAAQPTDTLAVPITPQAIEKTATSEPSAPLTAAQTPIPPTDTPTPTTKPQTPTPEPVVLLISDEVFAWEGDYIGQEPPGLTPELFFSEEEGSPGN